MPAKKKLSDKADRRRRAKVLVGTDKSGEPVYKYASGRTNAELDANKAELRKRHINGVEEVRRDVLLSVFAQEWYDTYKKPNLSPAGRSSYSAVFNEHLFPAFGDRQMRAITAMQLQKFMNSKAGMSKSSIEKIYQRTRSVFSAATAHGVIDRDPASSLTMPHGEEKGWRALTDAERTAALHVGSTYSEGLILLLTFYTGARIGEILGLQWGDIDFVEQTIRIERDIDFETCSEGELKTESSKRVIPLATQLQRVLEPIRGIGKAYILQRPNGLHLSNHALRSRWDRLMCAMYAFDNTIEHKPVTVRSRIKKHKKPEVHLPQKSIVTPHYFRHNYATILYNADIDVLTAQKWLGHSDIKTTLGIYSHLGKDKEDKSIKKFFAAFENF